MRTPLASLLVLLIIFAGLAVPAHADDHDEAMGLGRMTVEGVVASISPDTSTFWLRILRPDLVWQFGFEYLPVWVQRGTRIGDDEDRWNGESAMRAFRPGDRLRVEGFRLDDGRLVAFQIDIRARAFGALPQSIPEVIVRGVVVSREPGLIVVLDVAVGTRIIFLSESTHFAGLRASWSALQPRDMVVVLGVPGADRTVVAREVKIIGIPR